MGGGKLLAWKKPVNKSEQRQIALGAARSYLRRQGIEPLRASVDDAFAALDDLARRDGDLVASCWYTAMSKNQERLFVRDWNRQQLPWMQFLSVRLDITAEDIQAELTERGIQGTPQNVQYVIVGISGIARAWASAALQDATKEDLEGWIAAE
jgi:hypothetical protein